MAEIVREKTGNLYFNVRIESAESGEKALDSLETNNYDLIISRQITDDITGTALAEAVKGKNIDIPFILISGKENEPEVLDALYRGLEITILSDSDMEYATEQIINRIISAREEKRIKEELYEDSNRYKALISGFDGMIYICSRDYKIEYMNDAFIQRTGRDAKGELCYKILHNRDSVCPWCVNDRVFAGETVNLETKSPKDNRWYRFINSPVYHNDGSVSKETVIMDITPLKKAEEMIEQSNTIMQGIFDSASYLGIMATDDKGIITLFSKGAEKLLGYRSEEVKGIKNAKIFHLESEIAEKQKELSEIFGRPVKGRDIFVEIAKEKGYDKSEWTFIRKDGTHIIGDLTVSILRDKSGNDIGSLGIFNDVTDKKRLEEAFETYKIQSSGIITYIPNPTFAIDNKGTVIAWNKAIENLTGVPASDILGKGNYAYALPFYGQRKPTLINFVDITDQEFNSLGYTVLERTDDAISIESTAVKIKGKEYFLRANASLIHDSSGNIIGAIESLTDITSLKNAESALRESEEKFRGFAERSSDMILSTNTKGIITYASPSVVEILGFEPEYMQGKVNEDFVYPEESERIKTDMENLKAGEPYQVFEVHMKKKDGSYALIEVSGSPIIANGTFKGFQVIGRDITERKKTQMRILKLLRDQKELLKIINTSPAVVFLWNAEGNWTVEKVSKNISLFGYSHEDFISGKLTFRSIIHPDDLQMVTDGIEYYGSRHIDEFVQTYRIFGSDKTEYWIEDFTRIRRNKKGEITHYQGIIIDISSRKEAEDALAREKANVEYILDSLPGMFYMFYMFDSNGRFVRWNKNLETLTGYSEKEVKNMKPLEFIDEKYKEDIANGIKKAFSDGYADLEAVIITKDKKRVPFFFSANRKIIDNTPYILGMGLDITATKEAEKEIRKLASIVQHSRELISLTDFSGSIFFMNKAGRKMLGIDEKDDTRYKISDFLSDSQYQLIQSEVFAAIKEKGSWEGDLQFLRIDNGKPVEVHVMTFAIKDPETDELWSIANISLDITERKKAETALKEVNNKLNLLGSITRHDILNQLTVAEGYMEILELNGFFSGNEQAEEYAKNIMSAIGTIERQILFTKDYQDLGKQSPEWFNVYKIIELNYSNLSFQKISLVNETDNLEIYADPLFEKVIYNLLDNAVKHGKTITTITFSFREEDEHLDLICEDDGAGVPENVKEEIFERKYYSHTGLGLFLSREILSITGLSIHETGEEGKGARFVIHVPKGLFRFGDT